MLGIPTVVDRVIQQAIAQWLNPQYECEFSAHSYGFRKGRNTPQVVQQAQHSLNEGKSWVIELDLEKFFDCVNHDKLMALLSHGITDKRLLKLIRSYVGNGIMEGGLVGPRTEGTPQQLKLGANRAKTSVSRGFWSTLLGFSILPDCT